MKTIPFSESARDVWHDTATNEQLRDWLAERQGWKLECFVDDKSRRKTSPLWCRGNVALGDNEHIIPNTIDAAAKCLPEGDIVEMTQSVVSALRTKDGSRVFVPRTADERTDRFRLAVKAIRAMEDGK